MGREPCTARAAAAACSFARCSRSCLPRRRSWQRATCFTARPGYPASSIAPTCPRRAKPTARRPTTNSYDSLRWVVESNGSNKTKSTSTTNPHASRKADQAQGGLSAFVERRHEEREKCPDQTALTPPILPSARGESRTRKGEWRPTSSQVRPRLAPPVRAQTAPDRSRPGSSCASSEPSGVAHRSRASPRSCPRVAQRRAGGRGQGCPILSSSRPPCHPSIGRC